MRIERTHGADTFQFNALYHFHNKENRAPARLNKQTGEMSNLYGNSEAQRVRWTLDQLANHIRAGKAFTPARFTQDWRRGDLFESAQLIGVDIDNDKDNPNPDLSVDHLRRDPFIAAHCALLYATPSSTPEYPRTRLVFVLDHRVYGKERYETLIRALLGRLAHLQPDNASDAARKFNGSTTNDYYLNPAARLPLRDLAALTVEEAIRDDQARTDRQRRDEERAARAHLPIDADRREKYVRAAYQSILDEISAVQHHRNNTLAGKTRSLLSLAAAAPDLYSYSDVAADVERFAPIAPDFDLSEVRSIIKSALKAKIEPRELPDFTYEPARQTQHNSVKLFFTGVKQPAPVSLSDAAIFEIANNLTPGAAMLARLMDAAQLPEEYSAADIQAALDRAGYSLSHSTFERALKLLDGVTLIKSSKCQTKENHLQSDKMRKKGRPTQYYRSLPDAERMASIKADILTRLIKAKFRDAKTPIPHIESKMLTDVFGIDLATGQAIADHLNMLAPLPASEQASAAARWQEVRAEYRRITQGLERTTVTRLKADEMPEEARRSPNAYLDHLRREIISLYDEQQISARKRGALVGIHDPRALARKEKQLGIVKHQQIKTVRIDDAGQIDSTARKYGAYPLRIMAFNADGIETARTHPSAPDVGQFIERQRAAGYSVAMEVQQASRIEIVERPSRPTAPAIEKPAQPIERQAPAPRIEAPEPVELPGRYTEAWVLNHLLSRLIQHSSDTYGVQVTGEIIPSDLAGSLSELITAITGISIEPPTGAEERAG